MDNYKESIFDKIAIFYGFFFNSQKKHYNAILENVQKSLDLEIYHSLVDLGCGTGAFCDVLSKRGLHVTGVDSSEKMLNVARKKTKDSKIQFISASILERLPFEDKQFDISIASYVAHGLKTSERKHMYEEMRRITKHLLIIYDYNEKRSLLTDVVEWLERGDYFNFIKQVKDELKEEFGNLEVLDLHGKAAMYICRCSK